VAFFGLGGLSEIHGISIWAKIGLFAFGFSVLDLLSNIDNKLKPGSSK